MDEYTERINPDQARQINIVSDVANTLTNMLRGGWTNINVEFFFNGVACLKIYQTKNVGTRRHNKPKIPPDMKPSKEGEVIYSTFGFGTHLTIVSYIPKKNKSVILLRSTYYDPVVDENRRKTGITLFYNKTKSEFDFLNQKVRM